MKNYIGILLALLPLFCQAQKNYPAMLQQYMQAQAAVHEFSAAVLVARKGRIIYSQAFNNANREWNIANSIDTKFPAASLTKQFTAAAILQLETKGLLHTKDKLSKYFPGYPRGDSVTIHMLLNHTSGIKECSENPDFFKLSPNIPIAALKDTLINSFKYLPYDFSPGSFWKYSNSGYILLGYIIEMVSGESYRNYLFKNIIQKAGMKNSDLLQQDSIVPHLAAGYSKTGDSWKKAPVMPLNILFSAGGLFTTTGDLFAWSQALYSGNIIPADALAKMTQPNHGESGAAYGLFVDKFFNRPAFHHQGAMQGFNSFMASYPNEELLIVILTNRDTNLDFISKGLAAIIFDKNVTLAYKRKPAIIDPAILKKYSGNFSSPDLPFTLNIIEKNNQLFLQLGRDIALVPEAASKFYIDEPDVEIQLQFQLNTQKEVIAVQYIEAGVLYEAVKLKDR